MKRGVSLENVSSSVLYTPQVPILGTPPWLQLGSAFTRQRSCSFGHCRECAGRLWFCSIIPAIAVSLTLSAAGLVLGVSSTRLSRIPVEVDDFVVDLGVEKENPQGVSSPIK